MRLLLSKYVLFVGVLGLLPVAWSCNDGQLPFFRELMGTDFSCSCRNTWTNEKTTCIENCSTCYLNLGLCTKKTILFTTFTGFFITNQGEWDLVNQETSVLMTYPEGGVIVTSTVDPYDSTSCSATLFNEACASCSVGSNACVDLDCSNFEYGGVKQGPYNCCGGTVELGTPYDYVGSVLTGIPLDCIVTGPTSKVCPGDTIPFTDPPTSAPVFPPTPNPTPNPTFQPTESPAIAPTNSPTMAPTNRPTMAPTPMPTGSPTNDTVDPNIIDATNKTFSPNAVSQPPPASTDSQAMSSIKTSNTTWFVFLSLFVIFYYQ